MPKYKMRRFQQTLDDFLQREKGKTTSKSILRQWYIQMFQVKMFLPPDNAQRDFRENVIRKGKNTSKITSKSKEWYIQMFQVKMFLPPDNAQRDFQENVITKGKNKMSLQRPTRFSRKCH